MSISTSTDAITLFKQAFPPNPNRHIVMLSYDETTGQKPTRQHLTSASDVALLHHLESGGDGERIGYQPGEADTTRVGCIDIDNHDRPQVDADSDLALLLDALKRLGLIYYVERSTRGGYHVWLFSHEELSYEDMHYVLQHALRQAKLIGVEVFPSIAGAEGKQIYLPYAGALASEEQLGRTYLADAEGRKVPASELGEMHRNSGPRLLDLANEERIHRERDAEGALRHEADLADLAPETFDDLTTCLLRPPESFARHLALAAALNVFDRAQKLDDGISFLKSDHLHKAWITDGSRTLEDWSNEIDRWVRTITEQREEDRNRYGLKYLTDIGFRIPKLKRTPDALFSKAGDVKKIPEREAAEALSRAMRHEGEHVWFDPSTASFFRYDGVTYVRDPFGEDNIKRWIGKYLERFDVSLSKTRLNSVTEFLVRDYLTRDLFREQNSRLIACQNGILDWTTLELVDPSPDFITIGAVKANYRPALDRDGAWTDYLQNAFAGAGGDDYILGLVQTLAEYGGYSLLPQTAEVVTRHILNLHGPSSTGKSTTWRILLGVLGDASTGDPQALGIGVDQALFEAQDWGAQLAGRRLAAFDELNTGDSKEGRNIINKLKTLAGDSPITVDPKFKQSSSARLGCRIIICTNSDLRVYEDAGNDSVFRRLLRLPYNNVISRQQERGGYERAILNDQDEIDRIFVWLLDGMKRLEANGWHFQHAHRLAAELEEAREDANPVIAYLRDWACVQDGARTPVGVLRKVYNEIFRQEAGYSNLTQGRFTERLGDAVRHLDWHESGVKKLNRGDRAWANITLQPDVIQRAADRGTITAEQAEKLG